MVDVTPFLSFNEKIISKDTIPFTLKTRNWCWCKYPNHQKGCRNAGKGILCPPNVAYQPEILTRYNVYYLFTCRFDFKTYKKEFEKELKKHIPPLSPKKIQGYLRSNLYYQKQLKTQFSEHVMKVAWDRDGEVYGCGSGLVYFGEEKPSMEAIGIQVLYDKESDVKGVYDLNNIKYELKPEDVIVFGVLACRMKELPPPKKEMQKSLLQWENTTKN